MSNKISKLNELIAIKTTLAVSTMWCVYLFTAWSLIPLFFPSVETIVLYTSSAILQLVLLPLIMLGQNLLGRNAEQRATQDHNALMEAVASIHHIMSEEDTESSELDDIKKRLENIEAKIDQIAGINTIATIIKKPVARSKPKK